MDFYVLLGIAREATEGEIKRAYKRLARRFHPDINPGDRESALRFQHILAAYETLADSDRRRRYDLGELNAEHSAFAMVAGFEGFDFSPGAHAERATTFGDLFGDVLASPLTRDLATRGGDVHVALDVSLDDVVAVARRSVSLTRNLTCEVCEGSGTRRDVTHVCPACEGTGDIRSVRGHMLFRSVCGRCAGTGHRPSDRCRHCSGRGVLARTEQVEVEIPAGVGDGAVVRRAGLGHAGSGGGALGDLFVTVSVAPHDLFRRLGDDIILEVPVALHEAALGARIALPSIDGAPARLRVPPGAQSGQRFRLRGRGMPALRDGRRGDLLAEVRIVLPVVIDERSKELLREFGSLQRDRVRDARFPADEEGV